MNFSHHEYLHLAKDHVVAFAQQDNNEGEVLELCTMEELEQELPKKLDPKKENRRKTVGVIRESIHEKKG